MPTQLSAVDNMPNEPLRKTIETAQKEYDITVRAAALTAWAEALISRDIGNEMAEHYLGALVSPSTGRSMRPPHPGATRPSGPKRSSHLACSIVCGRGDRGASGAG
ncbi:hypothetical protein QRN89_35315 [Streptomyces chengbuensis]|uniref:hypothetical protein n=1 Tax=Streptomyces TaxID=1883 RepID=UPI0025B5CECE|nr:hypothetical protein [Streptomyces sp. HUAS CB01]WJY54600.1 hypothetical protein QRN89_35315 [Streptomyces sp. HUAS CB01]